MFKRMLLKFLLSALLVSLSTLGWGESVRLSKTIDFPTYISIEQGIEIAERQIMIEAGRRAGAAIIRRDLLDGNALRSSVDVFASSVVTLSDVEHLVIEGSPRQLQVSATTSVDDSILEQQLQILQANRSLLAELDEVYAMRNEIEQLSAPGGGLIRRFNDVESSFSSALTLSSLDRLAEMTEIRKELDRIRRIADYRQVELLAPNDPQYSEGEVSITITSVDRVEGDYLIQVGVSGFKFKVVQEDYLGYNAERCFKTFAVVDVAGQAQSTEVGNDSRERSSQNRIAIDERLVFRVSASDLSGGRELETSAMHVLIDQCDNEPLAILERFDLGI
ncbi:hypothetical protein [uncultured Umboniibacter sp.]|uniref:hypothetical protein n=1 Tax=uncultured Umboniibacter sp. TaxID=1798917 RepID=UPI002639673D|nr:hypothetical protein [uncultured Umboniibacter sp.]